jgi:hypothetical protein
MDIRIDYTISRRLPGENDFTEIGFGGAGGRSVEDASHFVHAAIQNRQWETSPGMPDPEEL